MALELDLSLLVLNLQDVKESAVEAEARKAVNPYLLNTLYPMLLHENPPRLSEIDFRQFAAEDTADLAYYIYDHNGRAGQLLRINKSLCNEPPICSRARSFI